VILLFTDFGLEGPYTGQVKAVLWREAPTVPVFDLFADAPAQRPQEAGYLLAAYASSFPEGSIFLGVVDPGVGTSRPAEAHEVDGRWFVGPGNGLFEPVLRRGRVVRSFAIAESGPISASFHGRDLFAPVAGRLAAGVAPAAAGLAESAAFRQPDWPDDLPAIVYIDRYGNAMTGLRAALLPAGAMLTVGGLQLARARTFGDRPEGDAFWYANANGLAEIAVNRGRADRLPGIGLGAPIGIAGL
jgi:S-adenosylmethionine hydrolase